MSASPQLSEQLRFRNVPALTTGDYMQCAHAMQGILAVIGPDGYKDMKIYCDWLQNFRGNLMLPWHNYCIIILH